MNNKTFLHENASIIESNFSINSIDLSNAEVETNSLGSDSFIQENNEKEENFYNGIFEGLTDDPGKLVLLNFSCFLGAKNLSDLTLLTLEIQTVTRSIELG